MQYAACESGEYSQVPNASLSMPAYREDQSTRQYVPFEAEEPPRQTDFGAEQRDLPTEPNAAPNAFANALIKHSQLIRISLSELQSNNANRSHEMFAQDFGMQAPVASAGVHHTEDALFAQVHQNIDQLITDLQDAEQPFASQSAQPSRFDRMLQDVVSNQKLQWAVQLAILKQHLPPCDDCDTSNRPMKRSKLSQSGFTFEGLLKQRENKQSLLGNEGHTLLTGIQNWMQKEKLKNTEWIQKVANPLEALFASLQVDAMVNEDNTSLHYVARHQILDQLQKTADTLQNATIGIEPLGRTVARMQNEPIEKFVSSDCKQHIQDIWQTASNQLKHLREVFDKVDNSIVAITASTNQTNKVQNEEPKWITLEQSYRLKQQKHDSRKFEVLTALLRLNRDNAEEELVALIRQHSEKLLLEDDINPHWLLDLCKLRNDNYLQGLIDLCNPMQPTNVSGIAHLKEVYCNYLLKKTYLEWNPMIYTGTDDFAVLASHDKLTKSVQRFWGNMRKISMDSLFTKTDKLKAIETEFIKKQILMNEMELVRDFSKHKEKWVQLYKFFNEKTNIDAIENVMESYKDGLFVDFFKAIQKQTLEHWKNLPDNANDIDIMDEDTMNQIKQQPLFEFLRSLNKDTIENSVFYKNHEATKNVFNQLCPEEEIEAKPAMRAWNLVIATFQLYLQETIEKNAKNAWEQDYKTFLVDVGMPGISDEQYAKDLAMMLVAQSEGSTQLDDLKHLSVFLARSISFFLGGAISLFADEKKQTELKKAQKVILNFITPSPPVASAVSLNRAVFSSGTEATPADTFENNFQRYFEGYEEKIAITMQLQLEYLLRKSNTDLDLQKEDECVGMPTLHNSFKTVCGDIQANMQDLWQNMSECGFVPDVTLAYDRPYTDKYKLKATRHAKTAYWMLVMIKQMKHLGIEMPGCYIPNNFTFDTSDESSGNEAMRSLMLQYALETVFEVRNLQAYEQEEIQAFLALVGYNYALQKLSENESRTKRFQAVQEILRSPERAQKNLKLYAYAQAYVLLCSVTLTFWFYDDDTLGKGLVDLQTTADKNPGDFTLQSECAYKTLANLNLDFETLLNSIQDACLHMMLTGGHGVYASTQYYGTDGILLETQDVQNNVKYPNLWPLEHTKKILSLSNLTFWADNVMQSLQDKLPLTIKDVLAGILYKKQHPPPKAFEEAVLPLFDAGGIVRGVIDQLYITSIAKQVLADLVNKHSHLRSPLLSLEVMYTESQNDFYSEFVQLINMQEQLTKRYAGSRVTYAQDARQVANRYRVMCFVFQHAKVFQDHATGQTYLLDTRVQTQRSKEGPLALPCNTCEILVRSELVRSMEHATEKLRRHQTWKDEKTQALEDHKLEIAQELVDLDAELTRNKLAMAKQKLKRAELDFETKKQQESFNYEMQSLKKAEMELDTRIKEEANERARMESLHKMHSRNQDYQLKFDKANREVAKLEMDRVRLQQQQEAQTQKWVQIQSKKDLDMARQQQMQHQNDQMLLREQLLRKELNRYDTLAKARQAHLLAQTRQTNARTDLLNKDLADRNAPHALPVDQDHVDLIKGCISSLKTYLEQQSNKLMNFQIPNGANADTIKLKKLEFDLLNKGVAQAMKEMNELNKQLLAAQRQ